MTVMCCAEWLWLCVSLIRVLDIVNVQDHSYAQHTHTHTHTHIYGVMTIPASIDRFGDLDYLNTRGTRSHFLFVTAQVLHALKSTAARVLVLVVSMGYGVVKPRLGAAYKQIVVGGVIYFVLAAVYGVYHNKDQSLVRCPLILTLLLSLSV